jgi:hypothetical protein
VGTTLVCDDSYHIVPGERCVPVPASTHGSYVGTTLVCDDSYHILAGERCVALSHP